ncbi:hypothetical protein [Humibacter ginsenosidimutans]|uniref:hypothetical protein n=1 Tax=Humibacter ginsenosidimutans TaxID=2599293 RepID=UPI001FEF2551|nr:hypothetical protein [Humibacter ginsenosidimutans]
MDPSNPGAGDPGGILLAASKRQAHVEKLNAVAKVLRKTVSELDAASWTGSSQTAFVSAIDALVARLDELAGRVGAECRALIAYAGALDDIKVQQARIQSKLDDAKDDLRALERTDSTEHSTQRAQAAKSQDIDDLAAELTRLVSDREIADSVCVRALAASRSSGASTKPMTGSSGADFWSSAGAGMLLTLLKGADASELAKLLKANPLLVRDFWNNPPDPKAVAAWWKSLSKEQQHALETSVPGIIGNLGGVPYAARDTANRIQLNADSKNPNLTDAQRKAIAQLKRALKVGKERKNPYADRRLQPSRRRRREEPAAGRLVRRPRHGGQQHLDGAGHALQC